MSRRKWSSSSIMMSKRLTLMLGTFSLLLIFCWTLFFSSQTEAQDILLLRRGAGRPHKKENEEALRSQQLSFVSKVDTPSHTKEEATKSLCQPQNKIAFMKTHKTASSSVQNILLRYGLDNGLNFVLPSTGNHLNDPAHRYIITEPFKLEWLDEESNLLPWHKKLKESRQYDIFNLHTKWNYSAVKDLLGDRSIRFTILRNPVDLFESLYSYVDFETALKLDLHSYIQSLNTSKTLYMHRINQYLGMNQQLFDLGVPTGLLYSNHEIEKQISRIDQEFDFVLLSERFEESMVLLASKLCWPLDLVKSLKVNARKEAYKVELTPDEKQVLEAWQAGDMALYRHFAEKFETMVEEYGRDRMKADVKSLKELNAEARQRCVLSEGDSNHMDKNSLYKPFSNQVVGFNIRPEDHECRLLGMAENSLVELARTRQKARWGVKDK